MKALALLSAACAVALALGMAGEPHASTSCAGPGDVRFRAADGVRLNGHRFGQGTTAVVLAHQSRGSLCSWVPYARRLASKGYVAFAFDFRSRGKSQTVGIRRVRRIAGDVTAAAKYVRSRGATKVFLVGGSMGGSAVVVAGANTRPPVTGVVSLSAPTSFGGAEAEAAVPRLHVPVLYVAATDDAGGAFATDAQTLYEATPSVDKAIEIVPGAQHGIDLVSSPGPARDLLEQFLASH
jgi:alpha-beta hydrolase superfamily lysophospholipase